MSGLNPLQIEAIQLTGELVYIHVHVYTCTCRPYLHVHVRVYICTRLRFWVKLCCVVFISLPSCCVVLPSSFSVMYMSYACWEHCQYNIHTKKNSLLCYPYRAAREVHVSMYMYIDTCAG